MDAQCEWLTKTVGETVARGNANHAFDAAIRRTVSSILKFDFKIDIYQYASNAGGHTMGVNPRLGRRAFFASRMNISSVIVHAKPTELLSVRGNLEQIPGVEIHAATDDGKLVITIESETDGETASTFDRINVMDGVMSAAMVFHQFESDPDKEA
jgi:nitrate reductase NapD